MVFRIEFPLIAGCALGFIGMFFYLILSSTLPEYIPREHLSSMFIIMGVITIPFLIWMGFTKSDKEWKIEIEKNKKIQQESDEIIKKYDSMPDLNSKLEGD